MKKKSVSIMLAVLMILSINITAKASEVDEERIPEGYYSFGVREFNEGLATVVSRSDDSFNYINEQYEIVDLNRGRFRLMYPFFDGLAAVEDYDDGAIGYINKKGELVIPCQYGEFYGMGWNEVGFFKDGLALVFDKDYGYTESSFKLATIDKTGKIIKDFTEYNGLTADMNLVFDSGHILEEVVVEEVPEEVLSGKFTVQPMTYEIPVDWDRFNFETYNINNNMYFKLRALAFAVKDSDKKFDVTWDGEKNAINLISNQPYTAVGGEMDLPDTEPKEATRSTAIIMKDGIEVEIESYNIHGNNFVQLEDIAKLFDIGVTHEFYTQRYQLETRLSYEE